MSDQEKTFIERIRKMVIPLPLVIVIALFSTTLGVLAATGTTDSPTTPGSTNSYTLEDIYQRLDAGTAGSQSAFTEPSVAPGTGTMRDLNDIMLISPALDNTNGASTADVLSTKTFWGLTNGEWGPQAGSITTGSDIAGADGSKTFRISDGYYSGRTATANDSDLIAGNIKYGVELFGVTGALTGGNAWNLYSRVGSNYITDIYMVSDTEGWAVGSGSRADGYIYYYDGTGWSLHTEPADMGYDLDPLNAVHMVSATDGWAVGRWGAVYRYNGATDTWSRFADTAAFSHESIDMVSSTDGWAVGLDGEIYHFDGATWSLHSDVANAPPDNLFHVDMVSATDGWVVGENGRIYRYNGTTWNLHTNAGTNYDFRGVYMLSATDGWAVGESGLIYHYNGTSWSLHTDVGSTNLYSVQMVNATDGWAMGRSGRIYRYVGTNDTWNLHTTTSEGTSLYSVYMMSASDGWAVGENGRFYNYR